MDLGVAPAGLEEPERQDGERPRSQSTATQPISCGGELHAHVVPIGYKLGPVRAVRESAHRQSEPGRDAALLQSRQLVQLRNAEATRSGTSRSSPCTDQGSSLRRTSHSGCQLLHPQQQLACRLGNSQEMQFGGQCDLSHRLCQVGVIDNQRPARAAGDCTAARTAASLPEAGNAGHAAGLPFRSICKRLHHASGHRQH